jgi:hypothetical protein
LSGFEVLSFSINLFIWVPNQSRNFLSHQITSWVELFMCVLLLYLV